MRQKQIRKLVDDVAAFNAVSYFNGIFPENIPHPVLGESFFVEYSGGPTFFSLMLDGRLREDHIRGAIRLLVKLQKEARRGYEEGSLGIEEVLESPDYFSGRVADIFGAQVPDLKSAERIMQNYWPIENVLNSLPRELYSDRNLKNNLESLMPRANTLPLFTDFEGLRFLPPQIELVNLLEFYAPYLNGRQISDFLHFYVKEAGREGILFDEPSFLEGYKYAAVQRHIELCGYRIRDAGSGPGEDAKAAYFHLKRAGEYIKSICKESKDPLEKAALAVVLEEIKKCHLYDERLDDLITRDAAKLRVKPAKTRFKKAAAVFSSAFLIFLAYGAARADQRGLDFVNRIIFEGKNEFALIQEKDNEMELYFGGGNSLARMGSVTSDCVSWSPSRNLVLFRERSNYSIYNFASGEKKILEIDGKRDCPVFRTEGKLAGVTSMAFYQFDIKTGQEVMLFGFSDPSAYALSKDRERAAVISRRSINSFDFGEFEENHLWFEERMPKGVRIEWSPSSGKFAFSDNGLLYILNHSLGNVEKISLPENADALLWVSEEELLLVTKQGEPMARDFYRYSIRKGIIDKIGGNASRSIPAVSLDRRIAYPCSGSVCVFDGIVRVGSPVPPIKQMLWSSDSKRIYITYADDEHERVGVLNAETLSLEQIRDVDSRAGNLHLR